MPMSNPLPRRERPADDQNPTGAPLPVRALLRLAEPFRAAISLDRERLMEEAAAAAGLDDWGDPAFLAGLDRLLASAEGDAQLNVVGRLAARRAVGSALENRLHFVDALRRDREASASAPRRPLVVA